MVVAFCRVALGALILLPIAWRRGALRSLGKHKAAICAFALAEFAIPFSVIAFGVWLLHEHLGLGGILAFVLILLGSWLATRDSAAQHGPAGEAVA